jgi:hypothetical protein
MNILATHWNFFENPDEVLTGTGSGDAAGPT